MTIIYIIQAIPNKKYFINNKFKSRKSKNTFRYRLIYYNRNTGNIFFLVTQNDKFNQSKEVFNPPIK